MKKDIIKTYHLVKDVRKTIGDRYRASDLLDMVVSMRDIEERERANDLWEREERRHHKHQKQWLDLASRVVYVIERVAEKHIGDLK